MGLFLRDDVADPLPPGLVRAKTAKFGTQRALVASAERIKLESFSTADRPFVQWQQDAWNAYDKVGEVHYGLNFVANVMTRLRLYAAINVGSDSEPTEIDRAHDEGVDGIPQVSRKLAKDAAACMDEIQNDASTLIRTYTLNLSIPGEVLLAQLHDKEDPKGERKIWTMRSTEELQIRAGGAYLMDIRGQSAAGIPLGKDTYIARIWRQHPRYTREPDSSMLGIADAVEELLMLQRLVRSATRSRLNAGLLFVPDGVTASSATVTADPVEDEPLDPADGLPQPAVADPGGAFLAELMDSMVTPVSDEGSAAAVVPMLATGPGELGQQIVHKTFERSSDQWLVDRTERALERILQGLDVPKEVVSGLANVRYTNAIVIDDNLYRANIEPLALALVDALTSVYLRPLLRSMGYPEDEIRKVVVWYDPSAIVTRPNASENATVGYDRFIIGPDSWRRANGFSESDKPSEEELAFMLLTSKGQLPEDITATLLNTLLPTLLGQAREEAISQSPTAFPESASRLLKPVPSGPAPAPHPSQVPDQLPPRQEAQ